MGIEEFDPISQPKKLKSAKKLRELPDAQKLMIEAGDTIVKKEEYTKE